MSRSRSDWRRQLWGPGQALAVVQDAGLAVLHRRKLRDGLGPRRAAKPQPEAQMTARPQACSRASSSMRMPRTFTCQSTRPW